MAGRGSVVKRPWKDGRRVTYAIKYQLPDGRTKWESIGPNKKDAERVLADRIAALNHSTYRELNKATFSEFAERWLKNRKPHLKRSTHDGYCRYVELHLAHVFGSQQLQSITPDQIQDFVNYTLSRGLSPKSVNNVLGALRAMLNDAVKRGYLTKNPATEVDRLPVPHQEMKVMTPEQVHRFLEAVRPKFWLLFATATFCGLRRGELLALQWRDIDFDRARLRVERSVYRGDTIDPKTPHSKRWVDLPPSLATAFRDARPEGSIEKIGENPIFSTASGKEQTPDNLMKREFHPALRDAGLPHFRFHDLRHTFAALAVLAGQHPKAIQAALGHSSITTTLDRYGHLMPGAHAHTGEQLEETVGGITPPRTLGRTSEQPPQLPSGNNRGGDDK